MKHVRWFLCAVSLFAFCGISLGQQWDIISHKPGFASRDLVFLNDSVVVSVGFSHPIMRSQDGGYTWEPIAVPAISELRRLFFLDEQEGWAVGTDGTILHTSDGGVTWSLQLSGVETTLRGVFFLDAMDGWIVGYEGVYLRTTDGGANWERIEIEIDNENKDLLDIEFANQQIGWIVGGNSNGIFGYTSDGGATWDVEVDHAYDWTKDIHVFNETTRILSGKGLGSISGYIERIEADTSYITRFPNIPIHDLYFINDSVGYAIGHDYESLFAVTTDGGKTWDATYNVAYESFCVAFADANHGIIGSGFREFSNIFSTDDGGQSWQEVLPSRTHFVWVDFADESVGAVLGQKGAFLRSINGGETWEHTTTFHSTLRPIFRSSSDLWIAGCGEENEEWVLHHSIDSGLSWTDLAMPSANSRQDFAIVEDHIWMTSNGSYLDHSPDLGQTWETQTIGGVMDKLDFVNAEVGFAFNGNGSLRKTLDGGNNWTSLPFLAYPITAQDVDMLTEDIGYAVTHRNVYKTIDGSQNWEICLELESSMLTKVQFLDSLTGCAIESYSTGFSSWLTTDGGLTWSHDTLSIATLIKDIICEWPYFWAVGTDSTILRYSLIPSASQEAVQLPDKYSFSAFPNPFNSTTTLAFDIPQAGRVSLQVFDVTGRLVTTLQDRVMPAGTYAIPFEGSHLASGVYFVNLQGNTTAATRKIVLLK